MVKVKGHRKLGWTEVAREGLASLMGLQLGLENWGVLGHKGQGGYLKQGMGVRRNQILQAWSP